MRRTGTCISGHVRNVYRLRAKIRKTVCGVGETMKKAFKEYMEEIQSGAFPAEEHSYKIDDEVIERLYF